MRRKFFLIVTEINIAGNLKKTFLSVVLPFKINLSHKKKEKKMKKVKKFMEIFHECNASKNFKGSARKLQMAIFYCQLQRN